MTPDPLRVLLSLCAADALGAATEFKSPQAIEARYGTRFTAYAPGSVFGFAPGEATDDGQMTVASLLGYARGEGLAGVLTALREWLAAGPPDVGALTRAALAYGTPDGGAQAWAQSGFQSAGNGGLMRVAAAFVAGFRGEALAREAATLTALTHADPRCVYASVFFTAFLEALAAGLPYADAAEAGLRVMDCTEAAPALLGAGVFGVQTLRAQATFRAQDREARTQVRARVRSGLGGHLTSQSGFVLDTLEAAVKHGGAADWLACVEPAVRLGDDSDTVACVVGAVVGARGLDIPAALMPDLRLGHSWPGWERAWSAPEHLPALVQAAQRE